MLVELDADADVLLPLDVLVLCGVMLVELVIVMLNFRCCC
jgi:hypothetical protein